MPTTPRAEPVAQTQTADPIALLKTQNSTAVTTRATTQSAVPAANNKRWLIRTGCGTGGAGTQSP